MFDPKKIEDIRNQTKEWNAKIEKTLSKNPERRKDFQTTSGIEIRRVFSPPSRECRNIRGAEADYLLIVIHRCW